MEKGGQPAKSDGRKIGKMVTEKMIMEGGGGQKFLNWTNSFVTVPPKSRITIYRIWFIDNGKSVCLLQLMVAARDQARIDAMRQQLPAAF